MGVAKNLSWGQNLRPMTESGGGFVVRGEGLAENIFQN